MPLPITGITGSTALTEWFNLAGKLPLAMDETVVPVVNIGELSDIVYGPPCIAHVSVAAAVGFRSECELALPDTPSSSGSTALVERVLLSAPATMSYQIGLSAGLPAPTVVGEVAYRDVTLRGNPQAVFNGKNDAAASVLVASARVNLLQDTTIDLPLGWTLGVNANGGGQQGLMIRAGGNNQEIRVTCIWRERLPR